MISFNTLVIFIGSSLFGIIGFFLRLVINDVAYCKKNMHASELHIQEEIGKLKGKISVIESEMNTKVDYLASQTTKLTEDVRELTRAVMHMNANIKTNDSVGIKILEELQNMKK